MLDESSKVESKRDMTKELNEKLDKFIKEEKFEDAIRIRDYMELCSPDSEIHYSKHLNHTKFQ
jgi:protein-arginine kinase activator protein McsA